MTTKALMGITTASSLEQLWDAYTQILNEFGFDRIIYGRTRYFNEANPEDPNVGDPANLLILSNHDPCYVQYYIDERNFMKSPMFTWSYYNTGCASWSYVAELMASGEISAAELDIVQNNRKFGVEAGYTISFPTNSRRLKSTASLTARSGISQDEVDRIWNDNSDHLELASYIFDLKVSTLPHYTGNNLTKRQREVLEWIGDGKTTQDTATILGLTPATVEKHLRLARETLQVDTTAQAVLKAAFLNQMFIERRRDSRRQQRTASKSKTNQN